MLTEGEAAEIRANLFRGAHHLVETLPAHSWHRDKSKAVTAGRPHSSQALALGVFGTIGSLDSRHAIVEAWATELRLPAFGNAKIELEYMVSSDLLGEPKSTQVDAVIHGAVASALVECKFTEPDGGACSQTIPRRLADGRKAAQCNGSYTPQTNPLLKTKSSTSSRCALTAKGIRYWEHVPDVLGISADRNYEMCPFAGGSYQWMRNLVSAHALTLQSGRPHSFLVVYAEGPFPMPRKLRTDAWNQLQVQVTDKVILRTASFQDLVATAKKAALANDRSVISELSVWVDAKILAATR